MAEPVVQRAQVTAAGGGDVESLRGRMAAAAERGDVESLRGEVAAMAERRGLTVDELLTALAREGRRLIADGENTAVGEGLRVSVQDVGRWWPLGTATRAADADRPGGDPA